MASLEEDTTTSEQRAYFHSLAFMVAEAERPQSAAEMRTVLKVMYGRARRVAKLKFMPWDDWQAEQERLLIALMDEQCIPVPEDLRMATEA